MNGIIRLIALQLIYGDKRESNPRPLAIMTLKTQSENHTTRPLTHASATGLEPVREFPNGFQVHRLNHSAKLTIYIILYYIS